MTLSISRISETGLDIRLLQLWKILDDFLCRHTVREPAEDIVNGNTQTPDYGTPASLSGVNYDSFGIVHVLPASVPREHTLVELRETTSKPGILAS
jgi:hypothetical protein